MNRLQKRTIHGFTLVELMIVIAIIAILADILVPNFVRARSQSQYISCESNEKNIATAMEMYNTDHQSYCFLMSRLTPNYIKIIPSCPSAGTDTYQNTLNTFNNGDNKGEAYTFYCSGSFHNFLNVTKNCPQYDSTEGLFTGQQ